MATEITQPRNCAGEAMRFGWIGLSDALIVFEPLADLETACQKLYSASVMLA
jgi:hypothetical protein